MPGRNCRAGPRNSLPRQSGTCRRVASGAVVRYEAGPPHIMPVISVIIPIWNRAQSVGKAIDSALSQALPSGHAIEVIVVDDGSSDRPEEALACFGGSIRLLRHPENQGAAAARNTGCEAASGEYIAFLDSDDSWLPGKLVNTGNKVL